MRDVLIRMINSVRAKGNLISPMSSFDYLPPSTSPFFSFLFLDPTTPPTRPLPSLRRLPLLPSPAVTGSLAEGPDASARPALSTASLSASASPAT